MAAQELSSSVYSVVLVSSVAVVYYLAESKSVRLFRLW